MTNQELLGWLKVTDGSVRFWTVDEVTLRNKDEYLIYKGGEAGDFIQVSEDGKLTFGTYEYAWPHIGDACFQVKSTKQFDTQSEALTKLIEVVGSSFLMDFMGVRSYRS